MLLAVIVGPMTVLFGLGLARAGRLGLVALALVVCFWVLDPSARSLDTKSNVRGRCWAEVLTDEGARSKARHSVAELSAGIHECEALLCSG